MTKNAIEGASRSSKMAAGSILFIESDFRSSKMVTGGHYVNKFKQLSGVLIWNGDKCDQKWISIIQNGRRWPFCEKN